jgi:predicted RecB family nuclease
MCTPERGTLHEYEQILAQQQQANQRKYLEMLQPSSHDVLPYSVDNLDNAGDVLLNTTLKAGNLQAECALLTKMNTQLFEPTIFIGTHSINDTDILRLWFIGHVLTKVQGRHPPIGHIVAMDGKRSQIKLQQDHKTFIALLEPLQKWAASDTSPDEPPVLLNKHCPMCQFRVQCETKAIQEDNLSRLKGATPKVIRHYEKKGIFTVKQLSYIFRPRKRKKRAKNTAPRTHKIELQALAIRTGRIYLQELPTLTRQETELFLDIEGIPDQHSFYLIGLLVQRTDKLSYHSFWADSLQDERIIWLQFLDIIRQYPGAPIYHYGNYDWRAISKLGEKYKTDICFVKDHLVNINACIYGKIYFPIYSNSLKEIGKFIGTSWTSPLASGLQTLVWRYYWEITNREEYRDNLILYNKEDTDALRLLVNCLSEIQRSADTLPWVDFADNPKEISTPDGKEITDQFNAILKFSHTNRDNSLIRFRHHDDGRKGMIKQRKKRGPTKPKPRPTKKSIVPHREKCPRCENVSLRPTKIITKRTILDFTLTKNGMRKSVVESRSVKGYCPKCYKYFSPWDRKNQLYGRGFKAWIIYQRVALRLSYEIITEIVDEQFNETIRSSSIPYFIREFADYYRDTEKFNIQAMLKNPFIHVDETQISIRGINQYVWVFTDGQKTVFRLKETRESGIVHEFLADYKGVMISDFYPGYDSVKCTQQKCWSHLIRDLNEDLRLAPFDTELEFLILSVRDLILPIMETVQEYGLKHKYLHNFMPEIKDFYSNTIDNRYYKSELAIKYQKRFARYRDSLFTFIQQDSIPWHNNTAEMALRHLTVQEKISGSFYEKVTHDYLILLGIRQTCRFQNKSFFKFLFSGEVDIEQFGSRKRN